MKKVTNTSTGGRSRTQVALYTFLIGSAVLSIIQSSTYTRLSTISLPLQVIRGEQNDEADSCLSLDLGGDMDHLLSKYKHVLIVMPAKAAGTSFKSFTRDCMKAAGTPAVSKIDNPLNSPELTQRAFFRQLEIPSLVASHLYAKNADLCYVMKHATKDTLIVYSHREETGRLISSIKEVVARFCSNKNMQGFSTHMGNECRVEEGELLKTISERTHEIGCGSTQLLTCEAYDCVKDNDPNLVFLHYKQANQLQSLLAKHHCPGVEYQMANVGADKRAMSVVLSGKVVSLDEWLRTKAPMLELALWVKQDVSCQATTRGIERKLLACPNEALQISGQSYENERVQFPFP